jgi:hypothetical protein
MDRIDEPKKRPTRKEARNKKWLKRIRFIGILVSGAVVVLLSAKKKPGLQ